MNNNVHVDDAFDAENPHRQDAVSRDARREPRPGAYIHQNIHYHGNQGIDILHHAAALGAMYDSAESFSHPGCHPETRTKMVKDLYNWALDRDAQYTILWLHGPASAGKSAIMQTLSRKQGDTGTPGELSLMFNRWAAPPLAVSLESGGPDGSFLDFDTYPANLCFCDAVTVGGPNRETPDLLCILKRPAPLLEYSGAAGQPHSSFLGSDRLRKLFDTGQNVGLRSAVRRRSD
ncbi:hypothetical protein C8R45DRAFT_1075440 [Mycena sanguinolenta]|nr:hypothetical protein C8R45DRAFT_1075440 [Mycena sanguinolenta]